MAKKTIVEPSFGRSKVWDPCLPKGEQHTIYAPSIFFLLWKGDDSALKKLVNDYLVELTLSEKGAAQAPTKPTKPTKSKPPTDFVPVSDDDI